MTRVSASVICQLILLLILANPIFSQVVWPDSPEDTVERQPITAPASGLTVPTSSTIDPTLLPLQKEFFLDMFMERYPADGGYRVKRFRGYEFFDAVREREVEQKRTMLEAVWNEQFQIRGLPTTSLPDIGMPFKNCRYKVTGFKSRPTKGFGRHRAYDILVAEGTPVHAIGHGIVVATEQNWWKKVNHGEPIRIRSRAWWDTAAFEEKPISLRSGNFVVIYHPPAQGSINPGYYSFYAHLADGVPVKLGQIVGLDDVIGYVEHSGYNAMRRGHGHHLHMSVLMNLGKGYLEPVKFGKYWGILDEPAKHRRSKAARHHNKPRGRKSKNRHAELHIQTGAIDLFAYFDSHLAGNENTLTRNSAVSQPVTSNS